MRMDAFSAAVSLHMVDFVSPLLGILRRTHAAWKGVGKGSW
jgi:hypothetical protein